MVLGRMEGREEGVKLTRGTESPSRGIFNLATHNYVEVYNYILVYCIRHGKHGRTIIK